MAEEGRDAHGRFAPGSRGGPGRPPKGESLTEALRKIVDREKLGRVLWARAEAGDIVAIRYVYDRIDGQPRQSVDLNAEIVTGLAEFWDALRAEPDTEEDTAGVPEGRLA